MLTHFRVMTSLMGTLVLLFNIFGSQTACYAQHDSIRALEELGWEFDVEEATAEMRVTAPRHVNDVAWKHLTLLPSLRSLNLTLTDISDSSLEHLKELPQLRSLNLSGTRASDAGLKHLRELPHLRKLGLGSTSVTGCNVPASRGLAQDQMSRHRGPGEG